MMNATYAKLNSGEWGIRVVGTVHPGQSITVSKRDGSRKSETVGKVIWTGSGISLCSIGRDGGYAHSYRPRRNSDMVICRHCGSRTLGGDDWCMVCGRANYE